MMRKIFRENGLSIVLFGLFFFSFIIGQTVAGHLEYNREQRDHRQPTVSLYEYLGTGHFLEATMENWESEFLQMFTFIFLTTFLYQKGSAESKKLDEEEAVDRDPRLSKNKKDAPWPVRRGGWVLWLYERSLSLAFLLLFLGAFVLHAVGGAEEYNQDQLEHGGQPLSAFSYLGTSRFWFEAFQNWQSEFLAIGAMVVLTIFLRHRGAAESKPVDSPHSQTGKE
jgi:hypothetical protein